MRSVRCTACVLMLILVAAAGCQKAYYGAMEYVGVEKREILVDRSESLRDSLYRVRTVYGMALERLDAIAAPNALSPELRYEQAQLLYDECADRAAELRSDIAGTEDVANALFEDWIALNRAQTSESTRAAGQQRLDETREGFAAMMRPVRSAEGRIVPVLAALEGHVRHMKLNMDDASAATVRSELVRVRPDMTALLDQSQTAIDAANTFIHTMSRQLHRQKVGE